MRWDALFADLVAQADSRENFRRSAEIDERARIEVGSLALLDRLHPALGCWLRLRCVGPLALSGVLSRVGRDWLLLDEGDGREAVVALHAVLGIGGLGRLSAAPGHRRVADSRLGIRHVLRRIAGDRSSVRLWLVDGSMLSATIDRVGGDFVETAIHALGEPRRRADVREIQLVPLAAVAVVRREL
jgi:hypothetical protein